MAKSNVPTIVDGKLRVRDGATHVQIHETDENGALGSKLFYESTEGSADLFPLDMVSEQFIAQTWGNGAYRVGWYRVDSNGKKHRMGNSVAFEVKKTRRRNGTSSAGNTATAPASAGESAADFLRVYKEIQKEERAEARSFYEQQANRERQFYGAQVAALAAIMRGRAPKIDPGADEDDEDDEDEGAMPKWAGNFLEKIGEATGQIVKSIVDKKTG